MVCAASKPSDQPAHAQSDQSLWQSFEYFMTVKLLTENHLEFLSLKGGFTCQYATLLEIACHGLFVLALGHNLSV